MSITYRTLVGALGLFASVAACSAQTGSAEDEGPESTRVPENSASTSQAITSEWTCSTTSLGGGRWSRFCAMGDTGCVAIYSGGAWSGWDCNR